MPNNALLFGLIFQHYRECWIRQQQLKANFWRNMLVVGSSLIYYVWQIEIYSLIARNTKPTGNETNPFFIQLLQLTQKLLACLFNSLLAFLLTTFDDKNNLLLFGARKKLIILYTTGTSPNPTQAQMRTTNKWGQQFETNNDVFNIGPKCLTKLVVVFGRWIIYYFYGLSFALVFSQSPVTN